MRGPGQQTFIHPSVTQQIVTGTGKALVLECHSPVLKLAWASTDWTNTALPS